MASEAVLTLEPGSRFWFEGQVWEVDCFTGDSVRLRRGDRVRLVSTAGLLGQAQPLDPGPEEDEDGEAPGVLPGVVLAGLSPAQARRVHRRVDQVRVLLEPGADGASLTQRIAVRAREVGVSARTLSRWVERYEAFGPAGLADRRLLQGGRRSVDPRWDEACLQVLDSMVGGATPTRATVIARTNREFLEQAPDAKVPSDSVAYVRVEELSKGRYAFGAGKARRSVAARPAGAMGRLRAARPGEFFVLDSTPLDVFALEPVTHRWVNTELTIVMDVYSRTVRGLRLRPVAAKAADVASVLFQAVTPQRWGRVGDDRQGSYAGIPQALFVGEVGTVPDTIVVDHGRIYLSEHTASVCRRLGISIQPALTYKPTDKPVLERFFRTVRQGLLDKLAGYKGPDVASRGVDAEGQAFYYVSELEQMLREWVGDVYHHTPHAGLAKPESPREEMTPAQAHARGMAQCGRLRLPTREELFYDFLEVHWRTIQHYGVEVRSQRYDGPGLNCYRNRRSAQGGAHAGKWPILLDVDDVRYAYFRDPADGVFHQLVWEHAASLTTPFSQDAANFTRALSRQQHQFVDPAQAMADLLTRWQTQQVSDRRERNLAIRVAAAQATTVQANEPDAGALSAHDEASVPGVVDFLAHRARRADPVVVDDLEVFEQYYAEHPDSAGFEVFDE